MLTDPSALEADDMSTPPHDSNPTGPDADEVDEVDPDLDLEPHGSASDAPRSDESGEAHREHGEERASSAPPDELTPDPSDMRRWARSVMMRRGSRSRGGAVRFIPLPTSTRERAISIGLALGVLLLLCNVLPSGGIPAWILHGVDGLGGFALGRVAPAAPAPTPSLPAAEPTPTSTTDALAASPQGCRAGWPPLVTHRTPISSAPLTRAEVALTFDDGPSPVYTPQILAILHAAGAHATFFVLGRHVDRSPTLVQAERASGDAIGNHTYDHNWLPGLSADQLRANLAATTAAVQAATGDPCLWLFRPPFGTLPLQSPAAGEVQQEGWAVVDWSVDPKDWKRPGARAIAQWVSWHLYPGAIILLHDGAPDGQNGDRSQTVEALPAILAAVQARGLQAVTLPQLLLDAGIARPAPPPRPRLPTAGR